MAQGVLNQTGDMDPDFYNTKHDFSNGVQSEGVDVPNNSTASLLARNETVSGNKNHTGDLQRNGVDVATMGDIAGLPVVPQTGGGILTPNRVNQIRDGNTGYLLPLASEAANGIQIIIELPSRYAAGSDPEISISGSDTVTGPSGVDAEGVIRIEGDSNLNGVIIRLTSDGVSNWSL